MDLKSWHFKYIDFESKSKAKFNFSNATLGCVWILEFGFGFEF